MVRDRLVAGAVSVTFAPGTTPPEASVITPLIFPRSCASARAENTPRHKIILLNFRCTLIPPRKALDDHRYYTFFCCLCEQQKAFRRWLFLSKRLLPNCGAGRRWREAVWPAGHFVPEPV